MYFDFMYPCAHWRKQHGQENPNIWYEHVIGDVNRAYMKLLKSSLQSRNTQIRTYKTNNHKGWEWPDDLWAENNEDIRITFRKRWIAYNNVTEWFVGQEISGYFGVAGV